MDAEQTTWNLAKVKTEAVGAHAPFPVIMALLTLMHPDEVEDWTAERQETGGETNWQVVWLSSNAVVTCRARKAYGGWDAGSHDSKRQADAIDTDLRPLRQVTRVTLGPPDMVSGRGFWASWEVAATVQLETGNAIQIPAFPGGLRDTERAEAVVARLRTAAIG